jgi:hypothetical protein
MHAIATASTEVSSVPVWDDEAWEDLLNFIEERRVIPILGPASLRGGDRRHPAKWDAAS